MILAEWFHVIWSSLVIIWILYRLWKHFQYVKDFERRRALADITWNEMTIEERHEIVQLLYRELSARAEQLRRSQEQKVNWKQEGF